MVAFICKNVGVSGITPCYVKEVDGKFEARMGFALMGSGMMSEKELEACGHNPFHKRFHDNAAIGHGTTPNEAIEDMKKFLKEASDCLWAEEK